MAEEEKQHTEIKHEHSEKPIEKKAEHTQVKHEEKKVETKIENKKLNYALVNGNNLSMGYKVGADLCSMIRWRNVDAAIKMVEEVLAMKRAVMTNKREAPHRHGKGMMAGRYPVKAAADFLRLLKSLKATAIYNELPVEECIIMLAKSNKAAQPYRRGGRRFKRSHITLKLEKSRKFKLKNKGGQKAK